MNNWKYTKTRMERKDMKNNICSTFSFIKI